MITVTGSDAQSIAKWLAWAWEKGADARKYPALSKRLDFLADRYMFHAMDCVDTHLNGGVPLWWKG